MATSSSAAAASTSTVVKSSAIKKTKPVFVKVDSLTPESKGENLVVQVVELKVVLDRTKMDGKHIKIAEVLVGDSTGTIILTARNGQATQEADQVDSLEVGSWLYIRNARIEMHTAHMRLIVDRWGLIEPIPAKDQPKNEQVATDPKKNLSLEEYELVDNAQ